MKTNNIIAAAVAAMVLLTACEDKMFSDVAQLSLSKRRLYTTTEALSFQASGDLTATLNVQAENTSWRIGQYPDWITNVSETSGSGSASVVFTAKENLSPDVALAGSVSLVSTSGDFAYEKTLPVVQQQAPVRLNPSETSHAFTTGSSASCEISVDANIDWTASCSESWVTLSYTADKLSISVAENTDDSGRSAAVLLKRAGSNDAHKQINITQPKAKIEGVSGTVTFEPDGGEKQVTFSAEVSWSAEVDTEGTGWLSISEGQNSGGAGSRTISIKAKPNISRVAQSTYLYINIGGHRESTIVVKQDAASITVSKANLDYEADGGTQSVNVTSNFSCSAKSDAMDWCPVNASGIIGSEQPVDITVESHQSTNSRSANVTIGSGNVNEQVNIYQSGRYFKNFPDTDRSIVFPAKGGERPITVDTDGEWEAKVELFGYYESVWLSAKQKDARTVVLEATANQDKEERKGRVIVSVSELSYTIEVTQKGADIYLDYNKEFKFDADGAVALNVNVVCNGANWTLYNESAMSFLEVERINKEGYEPYISIKAQPNSSVDERVDSVKVNVSSTENVLLKSVLTQLGRRIRFKEQSRWNLTGMGGEKNFIIEKNGDFNFSASASWIHVDALENESNVIHVKVDAIDNAEMTREGYVVVALEGLPDSDASADNSLKTDTLYISQNKRSLSVSGESALHDSHSANLEFVVTTDDTGWSLTADGKSIGSSYDGDWYEITIEANLCKVSIKDNPHVTARQVDLIFKCNNDNVSWPITITQPARKLNISTAPINVDFKEHSETRPLDTDAQYTVTISPESAKEWFTVTEDNGNVTFTCKRNSSTEARSATVTFTATDVDESLYRSIEVHQEGVTFSVDLDAASSTPVPALGGTVKYNITTIDEQEWTVRTSTPGVTFSAESGTFDGKEGKGNAVIVATIPHNTTASDRTVDIIFNSSLTGDVKHPVTQDGERIVLSSSANGKSFPSAGSTFTLNVTSNTNWELLSKPDWITLDVTSGTGDRVITATIDDNPSQSPRNGEIKFHTTTGSVSTDAVSISQNARYLTLLASGNEVTALDYLTDGTNTQGITAITVNTEGPWKAESNQAWVKLSNSGNTLTISVDPQTDLQQRSCTVTVSLTDGSGLQRSIQITQGSDVGKGDYDGDENWD